MHQLIISDINPIPSSNQAADLSVYLLLVPFFEQFFCLFVLLSRAFVTFVLPIRSSKLFCPLLIDVFPKYLQREPLVFFSLLLEMRWINFLYGSMHLQRVILFEQL